jgi:SAM-dependent methyltransferase
MRHRTILDAVANYYRRTFAEHGATAQGVDWNSPESQDRRFEQFELLFRDESGAFSVNDLGCGYGAFAAFLEERRPAAAYAGYELSEEMVDHARATFGARPNMRFILGTDLDPADFSVASGIFNVRLEFPEHEWEQYVEETVDDLRRASRKGFAFNMLTTYADSDRKRPDLYYADPCRVFDMCKRRYSRDVALLHDYGLWEFTMIVRTTQ